MPHSFWIHVLSILLTSFVILLPFPSAPSHPCKSSWFKKKRRRLTHCKLYQIHLIITNQFWSIDRRAHCLIAKATPLSLEIMSYLSWILVALIYSFQNHLFSSHRMQLQSYRYVFVLPSQTCFHLPPQPQPVRLAPIIIMIYMNSIFFY